MAQIAAVAKLTAAEGKGDELEAVIADLVRTVADTEPGTLVYAAARDSENADEFWFYELYASAEAAAAHTSGAALADAGRRMKGLLAGRPEVHRATPFASTGLPS